MTAKKIPAGALKQGCLAILDDVAKTHREVVITKRGKPVVEVRPAPGARKPIFGAMKGRIKILGDIISPIGEEDWEALRDGDAE